MGISDGISRRTVQVRPSPVSGGEDVEALRRLRNDCARFMTGRQTAIGPQEQQDWWGALRPGAWRCFLYRAPDGVAIAFGVLRERGGTWWVTGGVQDGWRGQGVGRQVFTHLVSLVPEAWLEVWEWNRPGRELYASLGFQETGRVGQVITMRLAPGAS